MSAKRFSAADRWDTESHLLIHRGPVTPPRHLRGQFGLDEKKNREIIQSSGITFLNSVTPEGSPAEIMASTPTWIAKLCSPACRTGVVLMAVAGYELIQSSIGRAAGPSGVPAGPSEW